ncbi:MAG: prepilin peptidase [bacterium]|nr:prepilin peptidase [bacterium]
MTPVFLILFFILGTIVGSFLNVTVLRLGTGQKKRERSFCLSCGHTLSPRDLVPLVSFLVLRGRCRYCQSRISFQYPLVELLTGFVFAAVFYKYSPLTAHYVLLTADLLMWSSLIALCVYDIRHKIIPNVFVYAFLVLALLQLFATNYLLRTTFFSLDFWGGFLLALFPALLWLFSRGRAMGLGDAKLALGFPWFLGLYHGISAFLIGFWVGALYALFGLALKFLSRFVTLPAGLNRMLRHLTIKSELPLAPFLVVGLFIVYLTGIDVTGLSRLLQANF